MGIRSRATIRNDLHIFLAEQTQGLDHGTGAADDAHLGLDPQGQPRPAVNQLHQLHRPDLNPCHAYGRFGVEACHRIEYGDDRIPFFLAELVFTHGKGHPEQRDRSDEDQKPHLRLCAQLVHSRSLPEKTLILNSAGGRRYLRIKSKHLPVVDPHRQDDFQVLFPFLKSINFVR